jgi:hypothetical protein
MFVLPRKLRRRLVRVVAAVDEAAVKAAKALHATAVANKCKRDAAKLEQDNQVRLARIEAEQNAVIEARAKHLRDSRKRARIDNAGGGQGEDGESGSADGHGEDDAGGQEEDGESGSADGHGEDDAGGQEKDGGSSADGNGEDDAGGGEDGEIANDDGSDGDEVDNDNHCGAAPSSGFGAPAEDIYHAGSFQLGSAYSLAVYKKFLALMKDGVSQLEAKISSTEVLHFVAPLLHWDGKSGLLLPEISFKVSDFGRFDLSMTSSKMVIQVSFNR